MNNRLWRWWAWIKLRSLKKVWVSSLMWIHCVNHDFKSIAFPTHVSIFWPLMHNECSHCPNTRASPIFLRSIFQTLAKSISSTSCADTRLMPIYCGIMMQAHVNVDSEDATWRDNSNLVMINNQCLYYTIQRWTFIRKISEILFWLQIPVPPLLSKGSIESKVSSKPRSNIST